MALPHLDNSLVRPYYTGRLSIKRPSVNINKVGNS